MTYGSWRENINQVAPTGTEADWQHASFLGAFSNTARPAAALHPLGRLYFNSQSFTLFERASSLGIPYWQNRGFAGLLAAGATYRGHFTNLEAALPHITQNGDVYYNRSERNVKVVGDFVAGVLPRVAYHASRLLDDRDLGHLETAIAEAAVAPLVPQPGQVGMGAVRRTEILSLGNPLAANNPGAGTGGNLVFSHFGVPDADMSIADLIDVTLIFNVSQRYSVEMVFTKAGLDVVGYHSVDVWEWDASGDVIPCIYWSSNINADAEKEYPRLKPNFFHVNQRNQTGKDSLLMFVDRSDDGTQITTVSMISFSLSLHRVERLEAHFRR